MNISLIEIVSTDSAILVGSVLTTSIKAQDVTVQPVDPGFDDGGKDFKEIDFQ